MNNKLDFLDDKWIIEATIDQLHRAMEDEKITSKQIVMTYLKRIALYDKSNQCINSVLEINPDAIHIAEALDTERQEKGTRGLLHGIPILLKDNVSTFDKMHTSAGSLALKDCFAPYDAFLVKKLKAAGAVILGKVNLTEFANFMTQNMPNGYSSRGGQVLNPYGPGKFDVGGSSSGSAASVAANFATVSIGTETSGSILSPSSQNSVVGIKPTLGLVSRTGIIPIAHSQDTAGPIARTVRDATILFSAIIGTDSEDPVTATIPPDFNRMFIGCLKEDGLNGAKIGIPREKYFDILDEDKLSIMNMAIEVMKNLGAEIIDNIEIPTPDIKLDYNVLYYEFKKDLNAYLDTLGPNAPVRSLKEIIEFNNSCPDQALKYGQTILIESEKTSGTLTDPEYIESIIRDHYYSREYGLDSVLKQYNLDALLFPANYGAGLPAKAGYPSITVPGGYTKAGEPLGVTFTGAAFSEPLLIKLAYSYEHATKHRIPPQL